MSFGELDLLEFLAMSESQSQVNEIVSGVATRWAIQTPVAEKENRLPIEIAVAKWSSIYSLFSARSEKEQDEVFSAVVHYFLSNGTSPSGKYAREMRTAGGIVVPADAIVKVTGRGDGEIRQFLRARMYDCYNALKFSIALRKDEALKDKAESKGIPRDKAYLMADWMTDCEFYTGFEQELARKYSVKTIAEANARYRVGGKTHNRSINEVVEVDTVEGLKNGQYVSGAGAGYSTVGGSY